MTDVRPFRGVRYDPTVVGDWGAVLGPPYDIITEAEAAALRARHPQHIQHIESAAGEAGAHAAAELLATWRSSGVLLQDPSPAYYVAEHAFQHGESAYTRTTLYAAVRLTAWGPGGVLPHEGTMSAPKAERTRLRRVVRADVSPLMALVPDRGGAVSALLQAAAEAAPVASGRDYRGETHTLRMITTADTIAALRDALGDETLYMADGHHRYEAALAYRDDCAAAAGDAWSGEEPENFVLMGLVTASDPGLLLGGTHRVVHTPAPADAVARVGERFTIQDLGSRRTGLGVDYLLAGMGTVRGDGPTIGAIGLEGDRLLLLLPGEATRAAMPASVPASWAELDAALLQYAVLEPVFGIDADALRAGSAVTYTHDAEAAWSAVWEGEASAAFFLNPPALEQIFAAADAGDRMPQKSTYFTPKLPTGVVLHTFD